MGHNGAERGRTAPFGGQEFVGWSTVGGVKFGFVVPWGDADDVGDLAAAAESRGLGRTVRVGAGVGRRCVGLARASPPCAPRRSASARCSPRRRDASPGSSPARSPPSIVCRTVGSPCRSGSGRSTRGFDDVRRGVRPSRDEPSCWTSVSTSCAGCGAASRSHYDGTHYQVAAEDFPTIGNVVQQPRVPIWCVGALGREKSMARAMRWDGLIPQVLDDGTVRQPHSTRSPVHARLAVADGLRHRGRGHDGRSTPPRRAPRPAPRGGSRAMWDAMSEPSPVTAAYDRLRQGPPADAASARPRAESAGRSAHRYRRLRDDDRDRVELRRHLGAPCATASPTPWRSCRANARSTWAEFDRRADGIAATLLRPARPQQDKVAHYLYNSPEYLESIFAVFKAGLVPREHQLPVHRRRARLPVGQRRRRRRRLPRHVRRPCEAVRHRVPGDRTPGSGSTTDPAPCPEWAIAVRGRRGVGHRTHVRTVGPLAATTSTCSTPAAPPACPRA